MARVMSLTFIVFLMVPVLAPSLGQLILWLAPWRSMFLIFGVFAAAVFVWVLLRLPETLHPEYRLMLTLRSHRARAALVLGNRTSLCYTLAMTVMFGSILAYVGMVQQIFEDVFHRAGLMPTHVCAVRIVDGRHRIPEFAHRRARRHAHHFARWTAAASSRSPALHVLIAALGLEQSVDLRGPAIGDHGLLRPDGIELRRHGDGAGGRGGRHRRLAAGIHQHLWRRGGRGADRAAIQRHDAAAGTGAPRGRRWAPAVCAVAEQGRLFRPHHASAGGAYGSAPFEV